MSDRTDQRTTATAGPRLKVTRVGREVHLVLTMASVYAADKYAERLMAALKRGPVNLTLAGKNPE